MLKTKFEVFTTKDGEEMVRFPEYCYDNGKPVKYSIKTDTDGHKFVPAPNPYGTLYTGKQIDKYSFYNMAGDAVKSIFDGYADTISVDKHWFINTCIDYYPMIYIDRLVGESANAKERETFKNAIWKYAAKFLLYPDGPDRFVYPEDADDSYIFFNTKEEANAFLHKYESKINVIVDKYYSLNSVQQRIYATELNSGDVEYGLNDTALGIILHATEKDPITDKIEKTYSFYLAQKVFMPARVSTKKETEMGIA